MKKDKKNKFYFISLYFLVFITILTGCRSEIKSGDHWYERFNDVNVFNQYIEKKNSDVSIKGKICSEFKLDGLNAKKITIVNSQFETIKAVNSKISFLTIKNSELKAVDLSNSKFEKLLISKSNLYKFRCKNCKINEFMMLDSEMKKSRITLVDNQMAIIQGSDIFSSHFFDSESLTFKIVDSEFDLERKSRFARLKANSLFVKNSILNTSFYESRIRKVVLENIRGGNAGFSRLEGESITVKDSRLDWLKLFVIARPLKYFESTNSSYATRLAIGGNQTIGNITIKDCPDVSNVSFSDAVIDTIAVSHCNFNLFKFWESRIKEISVQHAKINSFGYLAGWWHDFHFENFSFTDVYLDGTFEMENARIDNFRVTDLKRGKNFRVSENGVNFTLNPDDVP